MTVTHSLVPLLLSVPVIGSAPVPKEAPRPTAAAVRQAIGKSHLGKEVRAVGKAMGEDPVIHYSLWSKNVPDSAEETHFYLSWKAKGLELCFSQGDLHTAWMHAGGGEGFKPYKGELPDGLTFADDPAAVERKLGKPEKILTAPDKEGGRTDYIYKAKGVCVSFAKPGGSVLAVALFPPGDAPCW